MDMGFTRSHCVSALLNTSSLEQATEYILTHSPPSSEPNTPATEAPPTAETPASTAEPTTDLSVASRPDAENSSASLVASLTATETTQSSSTPVEEHVVSP